jgi:hypothetical protein
MVQAAPNRTEAECRVLSMPRPAANAGQVEFEVELIAAHDVSGTRNMLTSRVGQRLAVTARPELVPALQAGATVRLFLEVVGPGAPVQLRPAAR